MRDRSLPIVVTLMATVLALVGFPADLQADDSFADKLDGTFESVQNPKKERARLDKKVEGIVQQMPFYKRPFARGELKDATEPCDKVVFDVEGEKITITCGDRKPATAKMDGSPTEWTNEEGEPHTLTQKVESDRVVQAFKNDQGGRTNTYRLEGDDTLVLEVEITSSQMPEPLTYERKFERVD